MGSMPRSSKISTKASSSTRGSTWGTPNTSLATSAMSRLAASSLVAATRCVASRTPHSSSTWALLPSPVMISPSKSSPRASKAPSCMSTAMTSWPAPESTRATAVPNMLHPTTMMRARFAILGLPSRCRAQDARLHRAALGTVRGLRCGFGRGRGCGGCFVRRLVHDRHGKALAPPWTARCPLVRNLAPWEGAASPQASSAMADR